MRQATSILGLVLGLVLGGLVPSAARAQGCNGGGGGFQAPQGYAAPQFYGPPQGYQAPQFYAPPQFANYQAPQVFSYQAPQGYDYSGYSAQQFAPQPRQVYYSPPAPSFNFSYQQRGLLPGLLPRRTDLSFQAGPQGYQRQGY